MRRTLIVGTICALLGAAGVGFAQTETWTNFVLTAPTGGPTVSDVLACIEGSPSKTYNCSVSSIWSVLRSVSNIWSGPQEFNPNAFSLNGSTSGATIINAAATASGTLTLPAATDTLVGRATTDTLTNKTLTTPTINGSGGQLTLPAGPDTLVGRATTDTLTNKTLTAPALKGAGTGVGTLQYANSSSSATLTVPATTGTAITTGDAGTVTGTMIASATVTGSNIASNGVANANLAQMAANTLKGNNTGSPANAADLTEAQVATMLNTVGGVLKSKVVTFTKNLADASTTQSVTGVGFTPTSIIFLGAVAGAGTFSAGLVDSSKAGVNIQQAGSTSWGADGSSAIHLQNSSNQGQNGVVNSFDADGFTIGWTQIGGGTAATGTIYALCFR